MNCLKCGNALREDAKFCMVCGQKIPRCPTCGALLQKRVKFCMMDGTRIPEEILALIPQEVPAAAPAAAEVMPSLAEEPKTETPAMESAAEQEAPAAEDRVQEETPVAAAPEPVPVPEQPKPVHRRPTPKDPIPPAEEPFEPPVKKKSKSVIPIIAAAAAILLLVASLFAARTLFGSGKGQSALPGTTGSNPTEPDVTQADSQPQETQVPQILMPNCVGWHYDAVVQAFEALPGQVDFTYVYSDTVQENYILDQNLAEGSELTENSKVLFTVSKGPDVAPEGYNQKLTVTAAPGSSYGTLTLYDWENGQWVSKFSCNATLGVNGISPDYGEGTKRTPQGVFKLGVALTARNLTDIDWPVHLVTSDTCVIDDVNSPNYNTIQRIQNVPSGINYDPIGMVLSQGSSTICIYIEHNGNGFDTENVVPGKGSVITLCGRTSAIGPTPGCVDISSANMETLISMLSSGKNTHIEIYTE